MSINKIKNDYQNKNSNQQLNQTLSILSKYPDRVPIILKRKIDNIEYIDKEKYLVPKNLTIGQFIYIIRQRMELNSNEAIYLFVSNTVIQTSQEISYIYEQYKSKDQFLYLTYSKESTFG